MLDALAPLELTEQEIAEALWLASHVRGLGQEEPPPIAAPAGDTTAPALPPSAALPRTARTPRRPQDGRDRVPVFTARGRAPGDRSRTADVPSGTVPVPLPPSAVARDVTRALRSLRRPLAAPRANAGLDEARTVEAAARTGILWPVPLPARSRRMDVEVVTDTSVSMEMWTGLDADLRAGLRGSDAVGRVRAWWLESRDGLPLLRARGSVGRGPRPLRRIGDSSGRSVVLVVTDGVSRLWRDAGTAALLDLAGRCPVAVVEPLPSRMWRRTALGPRSEEVAAVPALAGGMRLRTTAAGRAGPAVPVLEPERGPLAEWAALAAGASRTAEMIVLTAPPRRAVELVDDSREPQLTGRQRVQRFRATASMTACDVAVALSVVPLSMPVMQAAVSVTVPGARPAHLAEVITGGLMHLDAAGRARGAAPSFQWMPGVREELGRLVTRGHEPEMVAALSSYLDRNLGIQTGSRQFEAIIALPGPGSGNSVTEGQPFAYILPETTRRILDRLPGYDTVRSGSRQQAEIIFRDRALDLARRVEAGDRGAEIDEAIRNLRQAGGGFAPDGPRSWETVSALAKLLLLRFQATRPEAGGGVAALDDLDEAVFLLREATTAEITSGERLAEGLSLLGECLTARYEVTASPEYLDDAVRTFRAALTAGDAADGARARRQTALAGVLLRHYELSGSSLSVFEAVDLLAAVLDRGELGESERFEAELTLARSLDLLSRDTRTPEDLDEADRQWVTVAGRAGAASPRTRDTVRTALAARITFLRRTGRSARTGPLISALEGLGPREGEGDG
ncbi:SAV_2336 N-terminal domain-related protein [Streptomyces sp. V4-01]|uniref:SAV_2336 N-terminal domain-related protein n=1 Tax=Actinacidiphila polyblastidii TaxID=3110430 RepID=A0ABU7PB87_9ACTN|nr:SAV_2336 N-terminal domain-related protein [Streptomyces sp. V4-01]